MLNLQATKVVNQNPFLPGFEAFDFKNWQPPVAADVSTGFEGSEEKKLEAILKNPKLKLSEEQTEAIGNFVETVANQTTATLGGIPEFERLRFVTCHDYKNQKGGRCEIALQMGSAAHLIRFGWSVTLNSEKGEESETVQFGITCLKRVVGLSSSEMSLIRGLNSWVKDSSVRWLRKQLSAAIRQGISVKEYVRAWRGSFDFDEFQRAMQRILSEPNRFAAAYQSELAKVRFAGRTISACKAAALLLSVGLPVPHEIVRRVLRGAKILYR